MLQQIKSYIKFLYHSKNEHGVHSPFVFCLLTQCFYQKKIKNQYNLLKIQAQKSNQPLNKKIKLLFRLAGYLKPQNIAILSNSNTVIAQALHLGNPSASISNVVIMGKKYDLIYLDTKEATIENFKYLLPTTSSQTLWIINQIHQNNTTKASWQFIQSLPQATVTIDTYGLGFVFFRPQQVKQHFILRVNYFL